METIPTAILVNGEEMVVDVPKFVVFAHQPGIRVDIPDSVEINSRTTIDVMSKMSQKAWVHISTGELFQHLFKMTFPAEGVREAVAIPDTIEKLNKGDFGVIHVAGMIVQACEAIFEGKKKIFFRNPEDTLHPATQRLIVSMMNEMLKLLCGDAEIEEIKD